MMTSAASIPITPAEPAKFRPHYIAPLKALCNRKFKSRFFAQSEDDSSARTVGH